MTDTITAAMSTRTIESVQSTTMPAGTRIQVVTIHPDSLADAYTSHIGTVVEHTAGGSPRVHFEHNHQGTSDWWIDAWRTLPAVGQRVTITACLAAAQPEFKDWATGREATYLSTGPDGEHLVRFDEVFASLGHDTASVFMVDFVLGAEVSTPVVESNPVGPDVKSYAERERDARQTFETFVEAINDMAEREEWCGNFEEFCEANGIESRRRRDKDYSVTIDLTYEIDADDVIAMFKRQVRGEHDDVDVESVTLTSTVVISVTTSEDSPHDMDSYDVESALNDAGYSGWDEWSITDYEDSY